MSLLEFTKIVQENETISFYVFNYLSIENAFKYSNGDWFFSNRVPFNKLDKISEWNVYEFLLNKQFFIIKNNCDNSYLIRYRKYTDKEWASLIIIKNWKKYKYNVFKKRRDTLKKELMAYIYHPSRLSFQF